MLCYADFSEKQPLNLCNGAVITVRVLRAEDLITQGSARTALSLGILSVLEYLHLPDARFVIYPDIL